MPIHVDTNVKLPELLTLIGAATAFFIALGQYVKAQRWKRAEFVAAELKAFSSDLAVKAVTTMLDWSDREIQLFRYNDDSDKRIVRVDYAMVCAALRIHSAESQFTREEAAIRDLFDCFLSYLEKFESFIEAHLVDEGDYLPYLHYWISALSGHDAGMNASGVLPVLWAFVDEYGYGRVRVFIGRYNMSAQSAISRSTPSEAVIQNGTLTEKPGAPHP